MWLRDVVLDVEVAELGGKEGDEGESGVAEEREGMGIAELDAFGVVLASGVASPDPDMLGVSRLVTVPAAFISSFALSTVEHQDATSAADFALT